MILYKIKNLPVNVLSIFDRSKENNTSKRVAEEKEEHANDDEEALVHANYHGQQQHLQSHLYSSHRHKKHIYYIISGK